MFYEFNYKMYSLFDALEQCRGVYQDPEYHPEGDVFVHSVQCLKWAMKESNDLDLIFAAMLHDVGKKIESKGHEKWSLKILEGQISDKTAWIIENHMRIWYYILGDMKKHSKVQELATHPWLPDLVQVARWDKLARNPNKKVNYDRVEIMDRLEKNCVDKKEEV